MIRTFHGSTITQSMIIVELYTGKKMGLIIEKKNPRRLQ